MSQVLVLLQGCLDNLVVSIVLLIPPAIVFALLALALKGRAAVAAARRAADEVRINFWLHLIDNIFMVPFLGLLIGLLDAALADAGLTGFQQQLWQNFGTYPTLLLCLFLGDFEGYWRHRLEHTRLLWPSHAVHHSDREMTWLTLDRFHPINRITTTILDSAFLSLMGFPAWAVVANTLVRHYYGYVIHADLPWTYGPLGRLVVSPAMHHWHHARDIRYAGTNFATLFSVFDAAFGTYRGGICDVPVGLDDEMGTGVRGQLAYPLRTWWSWWRRRPAAPPATTSTPTPATIAEP
ncbi:MAG TPA: sterol desaturase family protein [Devosiaceae bacterium]|jgi:sterol desaturase/sphingolipid hydroxylase (fatty acid hydroxylase superfamily)|nr:sterol desaturase family protein [Devosiaceae bacterium]